EEMELLGKEIAAGSAVTHEGVVGPAVPKAANDVRELDGTVVALLMLIVLGTSEIPRFRLVGRGHHIPAGAAVADMVERGKFAGDVVGLVVAGGGGRYEADPLGHRGDRGEKCQWLEAGHVLRP